MKNFTLATFISIFGTLITSANPPASPFGDVNIETPIYTADETRLVVSNAIKDIPKSVTNLVKGLTDAPIAMKRGVYDLNVYKQTGDWNISSIALSWRKGNESFSGSFYLHDEGEAAWKDGDSERYITAYNGIFHYLDENGEEKFTFPQFPLEGTTANGYTYTVSYTYKGTEQLATTTTIAPLVTNVVREVLNTVYDEKLAISWKQVMYDGNIYYVPVTNANITVVGD